MSALPGLIGRIGGAAASVGAVDSALFLGQDVVAPVVKDFLTDPVRQVQREESQAQEAQMLQMLRINRIRESKQRSITRLAAMRPDIYNQVASGRTLPDGATIIGRPDYDALDRLAHYMATGV